MSQSYTSCLTLSPKTSTYLRTLHTENIFNLIEENVENCLINNCKLYSNCDELNETLIILDYLGRAKDLEVVPPKLIPKTTSSLQSNAPVIQSLDNTLFVLISAMIQRFIDNAEKTIFEAAVQTLYNNKLQANQTHNSDNYYIDITVLSISKQIAKLSDVLVQMISEESCQNLCITNLSPQELELLVNLLLNEIYKES